MRVLDECRSFFERLYKKAIRREAHKDLSSQEADDWDTGSFHSSMPSLVSGWSDSESDN